MKKRDILSKITSIKVIFTVILMTIGLHFSANASSQTGIISSINNPEQLCRVLTEAYTISTSKEDAKSKLTNIPEKKWNDAAFTTLWNIMNSKKREAIMDILSTISAGFTHYEYNNHRSSYSLVFEINETEYTELEKFLTELAKPTSLHKAWIECSSSLFGKNKQDHK